MKKIPVWLFLSTALFVRAEQIDWRSSEERDSVRISVTLEKNILLHRDQTVVEAFAENEKKILPSEEPSKMTDYAGPGSFSWKFDGHPAKIHIQYQGCTNDGLCFLPEEKTFSFDGNRKKKEVGNLTPENPAFEIIRQSAGYQNPEEFLNFLEGGKPDSGFAGKSAFMIFLLTFLGGILLNLTPCVLPMIPINLAIIGAKTGSRGMRLFRGLLYGGGIAAAYGISGVIVILTGSTFGELASSWYFNAGAGVIFILLGLSLFDLFLLDFSKYKTKFSFPKTRLIGVFAMGALSALLAGACVAPVAVSALLQGGKMYQEGTIAGLCLPFVLGLGMALPWPAAAAGMAVLPKPGTWMNFVKYGFGILIIGIGFYYLRIAYGMFRLPEDGNISGRQQLAGALKESGKSGKEVLIDFHAQWCKNCHAMDRTTLRDNRVKEKLKQFIFVKFDASEITSPEVKGVLKQFHVQGLPAYVILRGKQPQ